MTRFLCLHPLGFPAWVAFIVSGLIIMNRAILDELSGRGAEVTRSLLTGIDVLSFLIAILTWCRMMSYHGKETTRPRCKAPFSRLLVESDVSVVASRDDTRTYTGQAAIRDRNFRVAGYVDEQHTMPVTVKTILAIRKYRCKTCGHRWEGTEVGNVVL